MRLRARQNRFRRKPVLERSNRGTAAASAIVFILVAALACGREMPSPTPSSSRGLVEGSAQNVPQATAPITSLLPVQSQVEGTGEKEDLFDGAQGRPAVYQSRGRRDPFRPPRAKTAEKPQTVHFKLTGIIRSAHSYYALVESDSSPGMGYVIRENDVVDAAKVVKITKDSVVFEVQAKNSEGKLRSRYVEKHMRSVESR